MDAFYSIQINSGHVEQCAAGGAIGLSLQGKIESTPSFYVETDQSRLSVIRLRPSLPDVGPMHSISVSYRGSAKEHNWYLVSVEVVHDRTGRYRFFPCNQWLSAGSTITSTAQATVRRSGKFEVFRGKEGDYYFRLRAANGEIVAASEGYTAYRSALKGIRSVRENAVSAAIYDLTSFPSTGG